MPSKKSKTGSDKGGSKKSKRSGSFSSKDSKKGTGSSSERKGRSSRSGSVESDAAYMKPAPPPAVPIVPRGQSALYE
ncbi:hypothetical protein STCU_11157 [Strigomonas culicis]|uniref:Uncharacterized protein n=1 Tax=Strigomonas culicis TaxID=28005 RepID=S9TI39_9TRYP|nr:hypothetical protein STCU_11157 [Strigomonas culicis]|eukprot:EPY16539.1 hypothetical protein STCU_11157 [Strigomonas culicis]